MGLKEICITTYEWVDSAQYTNYWRALANAGLNLWDPEAMELVNSMHHPAVRLSDNVFGY